MEPQSLVTASRCQRFFPTLPADVRADTYARMREPIDEERAYCNKGNYMHMGQILMSIALYEKHGEPAKASGTSTMAGVPNSTRSVLCQHIGPTLGKHTGVLARDREAACS